MKTIFNRFSTFSEEIEQQLKRKEVEIIEQPVANLVSSPRGQIEFDDQLINEFNARLKSVEKRYAIREEEFSTNNKKILAEMAFLKSTISKLHDTEVDNMRTYSEYILNISEKVEKEFGSFQSTYQEKLKSSEQKQSAEFKNHFFNMENLTKQLFKNSEEQLAELRMKVVRNEEENNFKELDSKYTLNESEMKLLKDHARRITDMEKNYVILSNNMSFHNLTKEIFKLSDNLSNKTNINLLVVDQYQLQFQHLVRIQLILIYQFIMMKSFVLSSY